MANDTVVKKAPARKAPAKKTAKTAAKKAPAKLATPRTAPAPTAGWYPDPADPTVQRYWDGGGWDDTRGSSAVGGPTPDELFAAAPAQGSPASGNTDAAATDTITFRGRVIQVRRPSEDQLALWKRIAARAETFRAEIDTPKPCRACQGSGYTAPDVLCEECSGTGNAHVGTTLRLFNQALTIISSVMVKESDRDWLEDELIAGRIELSDASEIVQLAITNLFPASARAPRNGPVKQARRRK